jgi:hypothetical protein
MQGGAMARAGFVRVPADGMLPAAFRIPKKARANELLEHH